MPGKQELHILWTNADLDTSLHMVLLYATNGMLKGWWDAVNVIVWGAPARLVAENAEVQERMKEAREAGVHFLACKVCAERLGVVEALENMGIEVKLMGQPLTDLIQGRENLITV